MYRSPVYKLKNLRTMLTETFSPWRVVHPPCLFLFLPSLKSTFSQCPPSFGLSWIHPSLFLFSSVSHKYILLVLIPSVSHKYILPCFSFLRSLISTSRPPSFSLSWVRPPCSPSFNLSWLHVRPVILPSASREYIPHVLRSSDSYEFILTVFLPFVSEEYCISLNILQYMSSRMNISTVYPSYKPCPPLFCLHVLPHYVSSDNIRSSAVSHECILSRSALQSILYSSYSIYD